MTESDAKRGCRWHTGWLLGLVDCIEAFLAVEMAARHGLFNITKRDKHKKKASRAPAQRRHHALSRGSLPMTGSTVDSARSPHTAAPPSWTNADEISDSEAEHVAFKSLHDHLVFKVSISG